MKYYDLRPATIANELDIDLGAWGHRGSLSQKEAFRESVDFIRHKAKELNISEEVVEEAIAKHS